MWKKLVIAALAACIGDGIDGEPGSLPTEENPSSPPRTATSFITAQPPDHPNPCKLLPDDDSACAHACDPHALVAFVPPGTCATFACPLTDGSIYMTGACNPMD